MKNVFITGASGGLGKSLAIYFASKGYSLCLHGFANYDALTILKEEIEVKYHVKVNLFKCDLNDPLNVYTMFEEFKKLNITIDTLILNAGIDNVCEVKDKTYESFMRVLNVNLISNFIMMQTFGFLMNETGGNICFINSDNAIDQNDDVTLEYDVSKSGLLMLAKDYQKAYSNLKIFSICPGFMDTGMADMPSDIKKLISFVSIDKVVECIYEMVSTDKKEDVVVIR